MLYFANIKSSITDQLSKLIILNDLAGTQPNLNKPLGQINLDILGFGQASNLAFNALHTE